MSKAISLTYHSAYMALSDRFTLDVRYPPSADMPAVVRHRVTSSGMRIIAEDNETRSLIETTGFRVR